MIYMYVILSYDAYTVERMWKHINMTLECAFLITFINNLHFYYLHF